ncbi:MAG: hypothetical protein Tsb0021_10510 [Chlamydiales bacterium]
MTYIEILYNNSIRLSHNFFCRNLSYDDRSWVYWGWNQINHPGYSSNRIMPRLIAIAMPLFASMDFAMQLMRDTRNDDRHYSQSLENSDCSSKILFVAMVTLGFIPLSLISPSQLYHKNVMESLKVEFFLKRWENYEEEPDRVKVAQEIREAYRLQKDCLKLEGISVSKLPYGIQCISSLKKVEIINCRLELNSTFFPEWASTSIQEIEVTSCNLKICSGGLKHLPGTKWRINLNTIHEFHEDAFEGNHTLKELDLSYNALNEIPKSLFECSALEEFNFSKNLLADFPTKEKLQRLTNLKKLDLSENLLKDVKSYWFFSNNIFGLPNLQSLSLKLNSLESLPKEAFDGAVKLEFLDLSYNRLKILPESLFDLIALKTLHLESNTFSSLPITQFEEMPVLDVFASGNPFIDFPSRELRSGTEIHYDEMLEIAIET